MKHSTGIISGVPQSELDDGEHGDSEDSAELAGFELRELTVPVSSHGERLDRTLALVVPEFSRSYLQQLIFAGAVTQNSNIQTKSSIKVKAGDALSIELRPTPQSQAFKPEEISLEVVFEDEFLKVINKPAGLVVHPAPGNWSGTLLNGLLASDSFAALLPRAGIVHRLDKDTSGLMVVARTRRTMDLLVDMIAERSVSRQYLAIAHNCWRGSKTRHVDLPVGRDVKNRLRMAVVDLAKNPGKPATTDITLIHSQENFSLVRCKLHTGRTHQIRVHMAAIGHPLLADIVYGGASDGFLHRQALHACHLAFRHPITGMQLAFDCALPLDMQGALKQHHLE